MATMRAARFPSPGADLEIITRERTAPGPRHVEIRVAACGVCHSDSVTKEGLFPGIAYPRVPGHEVIGIVDAVGPEVARLDSPASGSASAGTAAIAAIATPAGAATPSPARPKRW